MVLFWVFLLIISPSFFKHNRYNIFNLICFLFNLSLERNIFCVIFISIYLGLISIDHQVEDGPKGVFHNLLFQSRMVEALQHVIGR